jgi:hypothetical protein
MPERSSADADTEAWRQWLCVSIRDGGISWSGRAVQHNHRHSPMCNCTSEDAPLGAGPESITPAGSMDSGFTLRAPRNDERKVRPTGQISKSSPAPFAKIFRFTFDPNHFYIVRIPAQHRGAFRDRHERKVGMRWTRVARLTRALTCGWRSRVVLTPRRWRQVGESNFTNDGGKQARSPRRARRKPLKPLRAGMPGDPGATVVTNARAIYSTRAAAGATGTRHSPRPLFRGGRITQNSGASCRGKAKVCLTLAA